MNYLARQKKLADRMRLLGLDGMLVTHLPNVRYLCGFTGSAGILAIRVAGASLKAVFCSDGRYTAQAKAEVEGAKIVITRKSALLEACQWITRSRIRVLGFEAEYLSYDFYRHLTQTFRGNTRLKPASGAIGQLRSLKDAEEIEQMRAAALLAASLFPTALATISAGVPEAVVAGEMELQARRAGAEKMSFDTIVAAGVRSALPHGVASPNAIPDSGFVILDYGVILAGYCSDMTRTVYVGRAPAAHRRMYKAVLEAQLASVEAVGPGVETGAVDKAGRRVLKKAGFDAYFTHSTGHGVGMEVHEPPRLARGQKQKLEPGMVVTVEPGIYIPGQGGVRIEDMVLVTETGKEILTPTGRDLIEL